jgi:hypothetical protein
MSGCDRLPWPRASSRLPSDATVVGQHFATALILSGVTLVTCNRNVTADGGLDADKNLLFCSGHANPARGARMEVMFLRPNRPAAALTERMPASPEIMGTLRAAPTVGTPRHPREARR